MKQAIDTIHISSVVPDDCNANKGTERGGAMLENSLRMYGAGRSILLDKNNRVIAGNKTIEQAASIGMKDVAIVDSDGTKLIAVRRTDIDLNTPAGRELAIADNRTSEIGLSWDVNVLNELINDGVDVNTFWSEKELDELLASVPTVDEWENALSSLPEGDKSPFQQMTFTITNEQAETVKAALDLAKAQGAFIDTGNENSNGNALHRVCAEYVRCLGFSGSAGSN